MLRFKQFFLSCVILIAIFLASIPQALSQPGALQGIWSYTFYAISNVATNQTYTASPAAFSVTLPGGARFVQAILAVTGAVSGTTPTLNMAVQIVEPQSSSAFAPNSLVTTNCTATSCFAALELGPAVTNTANFSAMALLTSTIKILLTEGGTTPSFAGVYVTVIFSN